MKSWLKVTAQLQERPEDWAIWTEVFADHGVEGTVQEDNPPSLAGYLYDRSEESALVNALESAGATVLKEEVEEIDWAETWKQFFKPTEIGERWLIRPSWEDGTPPDSKRIEIVLDPGQAFGTGDHPTTKLCLTLLENLDLEGKEVLDLGTGSGILAVAANKLGARVTATDIELPSIEATLENLGRNSCRASVHQGSGLEPVRGQVFDLIISNIISATLIRLAPEIRTAISDQGDWILSGVILSNWPDVQTAAEREGFELVQYEELNDWVAAWFRLP